ncbi:DLA class II histocompatibility antigen, DR-1 beta chain-like [Pangshura tecta]
MVLRTHLAHCTEPPEHFRYQEKWECYFTNGTERVRYLYRHIYDRQQYAHFDSDLGWYEADTELGRPYAEYWNKNQPELDHRRAEVDTFCQHNYGMVQGWGRAVII